jgi:hypothetical protein
MNGGHCYGWLEFVGDSAQYYEEGVKRRIATQMIDYCFQSQLHHLLKLAADA